MQFSYDKKAPTKSPHGVTYGVLVVCNFFTITHSSERWGGGKNVHVVKLKMDIVLQHVVSYFFCELSSHLYIIYCMVSLILLYYKCISILCGKVPHIS
jgi:hypothetical protein